METISNTTCTKCQRCGEWTNYADDEHYKAIAARLAEVEADARRYRWLRDCSGTTNRQPHVAQWPAGSTEEALKYPQIKHVGLDAAIDAAIAQEAGRGEQ